MAKKALRDSPADGIKGGSWVWDKQQNRLVDKAEFYSRKGAQYGLQIIPDIDPYKSMMTGERIAGRRQHREHLRQHNLTEVGNEKIEPKRTDMPSARPGIIAAMHKAGLY